jgi:hypothetical protein
VANAAVRTLITPAITDYSNGYRFYDRRSVEIICGRPLRYGSPIYLTEVLSLLLAHHMRVGEFGSTYVGRGEGLSKLRMIDLVKAVVAVIDIAARFHLRRRPDPEHVARATTPTPVVGTARWEHLLVLAVVLLMGGATVRWAFFVDHYQQFDDLGLFNPPYMKAHYGKVTFPAHGEFRAMTIHPPLHYWIIGTLMRLGFRPYYAEAIPPFFMILLSLVLIGAGRFPVPVKLGCCSLRWSCTQLRSTLAFRTEHAARYSPHPGAFRRSRRIGERAHLGLEQSASVPGQPPLDVFLSAPLSRRGRIRRRGGLCAVGLG